MGTDFVVNINNQDKVFSQFNDVIEHIKQHLAQWNNFENTDIPQVIIVYKKVNDTPTLGVHTSEQIQVKDIFGQS